VSHLHERKEKICLNCNKALAGRYCHHCGQENVEPRESVWHLFVHFFNDVTHFDGKFFSTIKLLITKPGFLSEEYMKGRRASYLNPIRMYLFISFVFFLIKVSFPDKHDIVQVYREPSRSEQITNGRTNVSPIYSNTRGNAHNTPYDTVGAIQGIASERTIHEYDSAQKTLPPEKRDNFLNRYLTHRAIAVQNYTAAHPDTWVKDMLDSFVHSIPKMLFVSIPLFALVLWLLYIRSRKRYYFVAHGIFTIHLYCAVFLLLIATYPLNFMGNGTPQILHLVLLLAFPAIYIYKALRRFYKQRRFKTLVKFFIILLSSGVIFAVLGVGFIMNSLLAITSGGH